MAISARPMTAAEQKARYDEHGLHHLSRSCSTASEVAVLRAALDELLDEASRVARPTSR